VACARSVPSNPRVLAEPRRRSNVVATLRRVNRVAAASWYAPTSFVQRYSLRSLLPQSKLSTFLVSTKRSTRRCSGLIETRWWNGSGGMPLHGSFGL